MPIERAYFRTENRSHKKGDCVIVSDLNDGKQTVGIILSVEHHMFEQHGNYKESATWMLSAGSDRKTVRQSPV